MPNKKSIKLSAESLIKEIKNICETISYCKKLKLKKDEFKTWVYEFGLIKLYKAF